MTQSGGSIQLERNRQRSIEVVSRAGQGERSGIFYILGIIGVSLPRNVVRDAHTNGTLVSPIKQRNRTTGHISCIGRQVITRTINEGQLHCFTIIVKAHRIGLHGDHNGLGYTVNTIVIVSIY